MRNKLLGTNVYVGEKDLIGNGPSTQLKSGEWVKARPIGYISFLRTLKCAWKVIKHEADIVVWRQREN